MLEVLEIAPKFFCLHSHIRFVIIKEFEEKELLRRSFLGSHFSDFPTNLSQSSITC